MITVDWLLVYVLITKLTCVKTENDKKEGDAAEEDDEIVEEEEEEFSDDGDYNQVEKGLSAILNNSASIIIV